jgi:hypothetical protein
MAVLPWEILYSKALQSESEGLLEAHRIAVEAMLQRLYILTFEDRPVMAARTREKRALCTALSDLRVLRAAFKGSRDKRNVPVQTLRP